MKKTIESKYKKLDHIEHVLLRPQTYLGSNKAKTGLSWLYDIDSNKMIQEEITHIPSFIKIFDEILVNSVDESKREGSKLTTIKVSIKNNTITVVDNGGIDVVIHKEYKEYVPEVIFGNLMSGSNYDDSDERTGAGVNGLGSKLTNIFSTQFSVTTSDGKKQYHQVFSNNMRDRTKAVITKSTKAFTEISYTPELTRFGMSEIDESHSRMIMKRVFDIAGCNPELKIYYEGVLIPFKSFDDYVKLYSDEFYSDKNGLWSIGVCKSDNGYSQISFVNSTETYDGGTHVDYIMNQIIVKLRDFFKSKHKVDIKPSEIKPHMMMFINTTIINPSFSSQTKEKLITEAREFGSQYEVPDKIIKLIIKSEIVASILDWIEQKKKADESKLARELNKSVSSLKVDKLIDAKGNNHIINTLGLFEGDSAVNSFRTYRDANTQGAFALRGKFINCMDITIQKLSKNTEAVNIMAAMGLKIGQKAIREKLRYGKIYLYTDSDQDGNAISALLINFFYKFWSELFEYEMIYKVETPIVVVKNLKSKLKTALYTNVEYEKWLVGKNPKDWEIKYKKGLAALVDDEYAEIIRNPRLTLITSDHLSGDYLNIWFGGDASLRRTEIMK